MSAKRNLEYLNDCTKEELIDLVVAYAKNTVAMDGVWFQSIEKKFGQEEAMIHDHIAIERFEHSEGRRIKKWLGLEEHPGVEGLERALHFKFNGLSNIDESYIDEDGSLVYRIVDCRVQNARREKGLGLHPCKSVGIGEYSAFASEIDDRIVSECISCYPEITDETTCCAWRFRIAE